MRDCLSSSRAAILFSGVSFGPPVPSFFLNTYSGTLCFVRLWVPFGLSVFQQLFQIDFFLEE